MLLVAYGEEIVAFLKACWLEAKAIVATEGYWGAVTRRDLARDNRAQAGNLVSLVIGVMIAAIVVMQVFIPVILDAQTNLTGTEATISGLLPLFGVLLVLISLASPLMRRV